MFSLFFAGIQQDVRLAILPPVVCAVFRLIFILAYAPEKSPAGHWRKWYHCFRYGFWWGMDFHAYVYLLSLALVSLPAAFFPGYFAVGDTVRIVGLAAYLAVLYTAFAARMIFYFHFHDVFNHTVFLGKNADKRNFLDIFLHQHHGVWILLGYIPYLALCIFAAKWLLALPTVPLPQVGALPLQYTANAVIFLAAVALFYWCRYGGTFRHREKPEWDEVPEVVKADIFFAKATMDDLVALERLMKHAHHESLSHTDEEAAAIIAPVLPGALRPGGNPLDEFRREATGPRIAMPRHIFLLFGESYAQAPFDPIYDHLHLVEGGKAFRRLPGTVSFPHFLPGGTVSQTAIVSLLSGIYDADMELNENKDFWQGNVPTALAAQLKTLGYRTVFWYGGSLAWGSLEHYTPATGFDASMDGIRISPAHAPRTWLGVYDHIFLENAARIIRETDDGKPVFHFVYTTSNHGPFTIPVEDYGFRPDVHMPDLPPKAREDAAVMRHLGCYRYADKALCDFADAMRQAYPDSLFLVTGDHAAGIIPFSCGVIERTEPTIRERVLTSFAISHPELREEMFAGNAIGSHMHILSTLMELIAPKGFPYYSLFPPLTEPIHHVVTPYCWLDNESIGIYGDRIAQPLAITPAPLPTQTETERYAEERSAWCELTGWTVRHPEMMKMR